MNYKGAIFCFLILILFACQKEKEVRETPIKPQTPIVKDVELEKWRETVQKETFNFDLTQFKNPFITPKTYKFLSQKEETIPLVLVGIVDKNGKKMALLQDPTKKGYILKSGDRIGKFKVKEIGSDYIIIEEVGENIFGGKVKKTRKITLKRDIDQ